jgi:spermidine/putrescine transport system ATP-binding protein
MIEAREITKRFGSMVALDRVSLRVEAGEFLTLLGPSGCGKTTLLRILAGFETPDSGTAHLDGRDVTALPPYRRNLNQVFQSYALFPHLTVKENIGFGLRMRGVKGREKEARIAEAVRITSLAGLQARRPHQLSGGQRQRVALARALVCQPKVLLLDEPLSALDAKLRRAMQLELKRLHRQLGITFIFVTHDQHEAITMSDRIALMNQGRIVQLGTPETIYREPATAFAADFIGQANVLPVTVVARDAHAVWVRTAEGLELALDREALALGATTARIAVRPERISLSREPTPHSFSVRVDEHVFQGSTDWLRIVAAGGTSLQVVQPAAPGPLALRELRFGSIDAADIVVVAT